MDTSVIFGKLVMCLLSDLPEYVPEKSYSFCKSSVTFSLRIKLDPHVSGHVQIKLTDGIPMPLHEQAISILSFRTISVILVSGYLLLGLATTQDIFWKFGGIWSEGLIIFRSEALGTRVDNHHSVHVGGNKRPFFRLLIQIQKYNTLV